MKIDMGNDLKASMDTLLAGSNSKTAMAIKILAQSLDLKLTSLDEESRRRHQEIIDAISKNKEETDKAMKGIEVVRFFSSHPKIFAIIISCILILVGAGAENIYKIIIR